jgi:phospholipid N-methyltransferase
MAGENWLFFQAFLKAPKVVASVTPSSTFLKRRVIRTADIPAAKVVVELGPGTGGLTESLLDSMAPDALLLAIERTAEFVDNLERIDDRRFEIIHGCASTIVEQLEARGIEGADAIVSGIPFSTMPEDVSTRIAAAIGKALVPGGRFVAYQFTDWVARYLEPHLGTPNVAFEPLNVPPVRVFGWRKPAAADAAHNGTLRPI